MYRYTIVFMLFLLLLAACSTTEKPVQNDQVMNILKTSTERAGGQAAWDSLQMIKFGHSAILFEGETKSERNEMHQYTNGENPKKRVSFEGKDGELVTLAEIQGQYFRFVGELEDSLANTDEIGQYIQYRSIVSSLPFSIYAFKDKLQYIGTDSLTNGIDTEVIGMIGEKEKWWFFFSKEEGALVSFKHFNQGETNLVTINQKQKVNGFELPLYTKKYSVEKNVKTALREECYYAGWTLK